MANTLDAYIPELWANESAIILQENMVIANLIHRDFSNEVAKKGDLVHTRKPAEFNALRKGDNDDVTVQDASATDIQVPLDQHFHTSFRIRDGEESKSFKMLRDEYLFPAVLAQAQKIDKVLLGMVHEYYTNTEGLALLVTSSNVKDYMIETRKRMNINKVPEAGRNLILTPDTEAEALKLDTFTEADKVGDQGTALREASLGRKFQFNIFMCQNTPSVAGGPKGNATDPLVDLTAGYAIGTTVIHVDTAGSGLAVGNWITIAGDSVPHLITALGTLSTEDIDVTISPPLRAAVADNAIVTVAADALVNLVAGYAAGYDGEIIVDGITGTVPVGTGVKLSTAGTPNVLHDNVYSIIDKTDTTGNLTGITLNRPLKTALVNDDFIGFTPNADYNFAFHRNCMSMVSRPLAPAPSGLALSSVASANNVGVRVTITYDGVKQGVLVTVDLLMGVALLDVALGAPFVA
jgi:hypothetical protein